MYDLTVEEVHTFAVGEGDWVVHNENICTVFRGTTEQTRPDEIKVFKETGWILSDAAIKAYRTARSNGRSIEDAVAHGLAESSLIRSTQGTPISTARNHTHDGSSPRTWISFTLDATVAEQEFGLYQSFFVVDGIDIDNFPAVIDMHGLELSIYSEKEILIADGVQVNNGIRVGTLFNSDKELG